MGKTFLIITPNPNSVKEMIHTFDYITMKKLLNGKNQHKKQSYAK